MRTDAPAIADDAVAAAFAAFPEQARAGLLQLRTRIFALAAETPGVGPLQETLKWGQPAYLTAATGAGTTLRLGVPKSGGFALYVHCQTSIITDLRTAFPDALSYDGNRGVLFRHEEDARAVPVDHLILRALTYHRD